MTQAQQALGEVYRLLDKAQDLLGSHILVHGMSKEQPRTYAIGDEVYSLTEKAKRLIAGYDRPRARSSARSYRRRIIRRRG